MSEGVVIALLSMVSGGTGMLIQGWLQRRKDRADAAASEAAATIARADAVAGAEFADVRAQFAVAEKATQLYQHLQDMLRSTLAELDKAREDLRTAQVELHQARTTIERLSEDVKRFIAQEQDYQERLRASEERYHAVMERLTQLEQRA